MDHPDPASLAQGFYHIAQITTAGSTRVVTSQNDIRMTYRYEKPDSNNPEVISAVTARYSVFQAATASFQFTGLTGTTAVFTLYLVTMPNLAVLQDYIDRADVRNEANDVLVRAPVPCFVGASITILRAAGNTDVTADLIQAVVSAAINGTDIATSAITAELIVLAVSAAYPTVKVDFPMFLDSETYMPDGSVWIEQSCNGRIIPHEDLLQGVTTRNTAFFCYGSDINVTFKDM